MRLIHCRKCGAALVTVDALIERMNDTIHELNEKDRHSKKWENCKIVSCRGGKRYKDDERHSP